MANTAILQIAAPTSVLGAGPVWQIGVTIDTANSVLTVITPGGTITDLYGNTVRTQTADDLWWIVGMDWVDGQSMVLDIYSHNTILQSRELSSYQGFGIGVDKNRYIMAAAGAGQALKLRSSTDGPSSLVLHVILASELRGRN